MRSQDVGRERILANVKDNYIEEATENKLSGMEGEAVSARKRRKIKRNEIDILKGKIEMYNHSSTLIFRFSLL